MANLNLKDYFFHTQCIQYKALNHIFPFKKLLHEHVREHVNTMPSSATNLSKGYLL